MERSVTVQLLLPGWKGRWLHTAVMRGTDCLLALEQEDANLTRHGVERTSLANVKMHIMNNCSTMPFKLQLSRVRLSLIPMAR